MSLQIEARDASGARTGVFRTRSGKTMATPALVLPADHGTIPHLVGTMVAHINPTAGFGAYYTALESFLPMAADPAFDAQALASYLHPLCSPLHDAISICGLRRAVVARQYRSSKQAVAAQLGNGSVYRVTPEDYAAAADRFLPDVLIPIMDLEPQSEHVFDVGGGDLPETYLRRRGRRNLTYLKTMLSSLQRRQSLSVFGLLDGAIDDVVTFDGLCGYVLPMTENPDVLHLAKRLPEDRARLALSIASFDQVVECLRTGVDLFESSWIVNLSNQGLTFDFRNGSWISLKDDRFVDDLSPICPDCRCYACQGVRHTRAYIRHLFMIDDLLSYVLATIHNLHQLDVFFAGARNAIRAGSLDAFLSRFSC